MDGKHFSSPTRRHEGEPVFRRHWPNGISKFVKTVKLRPAIKNSLFVILHFVIHLLPAAILARLRWIGVLITLQPEAHPVHSAALRGHALSRIGQDMRASRQQD